MDPSPASAHGRKQHREPTHASALIYNGHGEYLLHLRDDIPGIREPGCWSLLGGGREPGDPCLEDTVRRELREEAGLRLPFSHSRSRRLGSRRRMSSAACTPAMFAGEPDAVNT